MVGEVDGGGGRGAPGSEGNDVATSGADWITEVAPQPASSRGIGHELIPQDSETRATTIEVKDLTYDRIDEPVNIAGTDSVAVTIYCDETSPGTVITLIEDHSRRAGIQDRIGPAPEEQSFEPTRYRT